MKSDTRRVYSQAAATYDREPNSVLFTETGVVLTLLDLRKEGSLLDAACCHRNSKKRQGPGLPPRTARGEATSRRT